jgi:lipopolysaccharide export system permease protein
MFKIRKFDRYLLQETTQPFLGGIIFFISIFLMFQFLRLADFLIVQGVSITPVLKLMGALTLTFMPLGLPISFLMAVLSGFGRLSQDSELVALKASGVSLHRMSVPVWVLATVVVIFSLGLNLSWAPRAEFRVQQLLFEIGNNRLKSAIKEGTFTGFYDLLLFTDHYDPVSREMKNVFIFDERDAKTPMTVISDSGRMIPVRDQKGELAALALQLETGNIHRSEAETRTYQRIDFKDYQLYMKFDPLAAGPSQKPKVGTIFRTLE